MAPVVQREKISSLKRKKKKKQAGGGSRLREKGAFRHSQGAMFQTSKERALVEKNGGAESLTKKVYLPRGVVQDLGQGEKCHSSQERKGLWNLHQKILFSDR